MQRQLTENIAGYGRRAGSLLGLMLLTAGCSGPPESTVVSVRLSSALGCRPTRIDSARIEALGDFPLRDEHVVVATDTSQVTLSGFPRTTSAIVVELTGGTFVGRGAVEIPAGTLGTSVLVLPPDRSCPIADPDVRLDEGASVVMLEDGSLLLVGGLLPDGTARRAVLALGAGEELADTDLRNLFNPSAFASTTPIGPREVLVAGGASERAGSGRDTFERLRLDDPPSAPLRGGTLAVGRRDHSALMLSDGSVLLVGGRGREGMLDSLEILSPEASRGVRVPVLLHHARAGATLVERADGSVVIAGGVEDGGPSSALEILSAERDAIEDVDLDLPPAASVAVLPGPRLFWLGVDGTVHHVLLDGAPTDPSGAPGVAELLAPVGPLAVSEAGEAVIRDAARSELVLFRRDGSTRRVPSSRSAGMLVAIRDGTFIELDATGASRFRPSPLSRFAPPPSTYQFPLDSGAVMLDSPTEGRFEPSAPGGRGALRAPMGGTLDVPEFELADHTVTVRMEGTGALRFTGRLGASGARVLLGQVRVEPNALSVGSCSVAREPETPIAITRRGDVLTLTAGLGTQTCSLALPDHVGIGLRLDPGSSVSSIALARLPMP